MPKRIPLKTGDDLRKARERLGLTQGEFALQLGFASGAGGQVHVSKLENGVHPITRSVAIIVRHLLKHGPLTAADLPTD
jgi:transcriptional regulator with XRE-family HTH domain